ncbi:pili assembly chaperone [Salmonella enterica]|nr:pili assembly chaperone [Salmonella enterica]
MSGNIGANPRIRRQQYFQQYEVPNETHKNVVIENSIKSQLI